MSLERRLGAGMVRHRAGAGDEAELASGGQIRIISEAVGSGDVELRTLH